MSEREIEHRVENDHGWFLNYETGETTEWEGIRIFWRPVGTRRWNKRVIVPDEALGQTVESLKADAAKIAEALARAASGEALTLD